jgi:hypothetical protein
MLNAAFNSVAGFDDGSNTPKTYKDVLKHANQKGWWDCMKNEFLAMDTGKLYPRHPCHQEGRSLLIDGSTTRRMMEVSDQERSHKVSVKYPAKILPIVMHQL